MIRSGWPYVTLTVRGVSLPFKFLPLPSERDELRRWFALAQVEMHELHAAAIKPDATPEDVAGMERAVLLLEGAVGYVLMRLWAGGESTTLAKWHDDASASDGVPVNFPGEDHKLLAGRAFIVELGESIGLSFELAARIVGHLFTLNPPAREPTAPEVDEITSFFGVEQGGTTLS